jgi:hypothetical protein
MADEGRQGAAKREDFREASGKGENYPGPSTGTEAGGVEGSIMEGEEGRSSGGKASTGAGSEATEGMHAADGRNQHDKSAVTNKATGRAGSSEIDRNASEPMDRTKEHKGSYGGEGGEPRTSSNEREKH